MTDHPHTSSRATPEPGALADRNCPICDRPNREHSINELTSCSLEARRAAQTAPPSLEQAATETIRQLDRLDERLRSTGPPGHVDYISKRSAAGVSRVLCDNLRAALTARRAAEDKRREALRECRRLFRHIIKHDGLTGSTMDEIGHLYFDRLRNMEI